MSEIMNKILDQVLPQPLDVDSFDGDYHNLYEINRDLFHESVDIHADIDVLFMKLPIRDKELWLDSILSPSQKCDRIVKKLDDHCETLSKYPQSIKFTESEYFTEVLTQHPLLTDNMYHDLKRALGFIMEMYSMNCNSVLARMVYTSISQIIERLYSKNSRNYHNLARYKDIIENTE